MGPLGLGNKSHQRSDGRREGSCGVFGGCWLLSSFGGVSSFLFCKFLHDMVKFVFFQYLCNFYQIRDQGTRICTQNQIKAQLHGNRNFHFFIIIFETKSKKINVIWKQELFSEYFLKQKQRKSQLCGMNEILYMYHLKSAHISDRMISCKNVNLVKTFRFF